jgi:hypothetical protein
LSVCDLPERRVRDEERHVVTGGFEHRQYLLDERRQLFAYSLRFDVHAKNAGPDA